MPKAKKKATRPLISTGRRFALVLAASALVAMGLPFLGTAGSGQAAAAKPAGGPAGADAQSTSTSKALASVERALRLLERQEASSKAHPDGATSIAQQRMNLQTTKEILQHRAALPSSSTKDVLAAARLAMIGQAASLGVTLPPQGAPFKQHSPSEAALKLVQRLEVAPTEQDRQTIAALNRFPRPVKDALGVYMSAFLAFQDATTDAFAKSGQAPPGQAGAANLDKASPNAGLTSDGASEKMGSLVPQLAAPHLEQILSSRLALLVAAERLAAAIATNPVETTVSRPAVSGAKEAKPPVSPEGPSNSGMESSPHSSGSSSLPQRGEIETPGPAAEQPANIPAPSAARKAPAQPAPDPVDGDRRLPEGPVELRLASSHSSSEEGQECQYEIAPAFCIDFSENTEDDTDAADNSYKNHYALQIDASGNDCYLNNAGGSGILMFDDPKISETRRANCVDKSIDDLTKLQFPYTAAGAAALLDLEGEDHYSTPNVAGGNGGGHTGTGFLVDLGDGNEHYEARSVAPLTHPDSGEAESHMGGLNGGGNQQGLGFLLDESGDDTYSVATTQEYRRCRPGMAECRRAVWGTNGGSAASGSGFLLDGGGGDSYSVLDPLPRGLCPEKSREDGTSGIGPHCQTFGANGGAGNNASGRLVDLGGDDQYRAGGAGTNGGGNDQGSRGFLLDAGGDDLYEGWDQGVNGGTAGLSPRDGDAVARNGGSGYLFDAAGHDSYTAGKWGTNGGGLARLAGGMLVDAGGHDRYKDDSKIDPEDPAADQQPSGTGLDRTVFPKGQGAQIDQNSPAADLEVTMSDAPDPVPSEHNLTYTITVTNRGLPPEQRVQQSSPDSSKTCSGAPDNLSCNPPSVHPGPSYVAHDVKAVTSPLARGVNFSWASDSCSFSASDRRVTCYLGDLEEQQQETVEVAVTPHLEPGEKVSNTVSVTSSPAGADQSSAASGSSAKDPDMSNNSATTETTVGDQRPVVAISVADAAPVMEGDAGTQTNGNLEISLSRPAESDVTVGYTTRDETARVADSDFRKTDGSVTFRSGETTKAVSVAVVGDDIDEPEETFALRLSRPVGASAVIDRGQGNVTIVDDDLAPAFSVDDVTLTETDPRAQDDSVNEDGLRRTLDQDRLVGNPSASPPEASLGSSRPAPLAGFRVSLAGGSARTVSVDFATTDATASVLDADYKPRTGTLTFAPGEGSKTVFVEIVPDDKSEADEDFLLELRNPRNADVERGEGRAVILDDDGTGERPYEGELIDADSYRYSDGERRSGGVFVTGHDSDDHGRDSVGAQRVIRAAVNYVTGAKRTPRLLYVTSDVTGPAGTSSSPSALNTTRIPRPPSSADEAVEHVEGNGNVSAGRNALPRALALSGFTYELAAADTSGPTEAGVRVHDLRTVRLADYDAVVVACVNDCDLTQAELDVLNGRTREIIEYVNGGGGLVVFEEGGPPAFQNTFGFLPFLRPSTNIAAALQREENFKVTEFGRRLGLSDTDVNGAYSHNVFLDAKGFGVVDVDGRGRIVSLATRRQINEFGAIDQSDEEGSRPGEDEAGIDAGLRSSSLEVTSKAVPLFRGPPTQLPPPAQPPGRPEAAGFARNPLAQQAPQSSAQTAAQVQAQMHLQAVAQAHHQAQTQNQMHVQVQAAPMKQEQRQAQVQLARVGEEGAPAPAKPPGKAQQAHLAVARRTSLPAGAMMGGLSVLMLSALAWANPRKEKRYKTAVVQGVSKAPALTRAAPRHRKR